MVLPDLSPALSSPGFLPRLWVCCQENSEDEASGRPEADGDCGVLASPHLCPQKGPRLTIHTAQQVLFVLETDLGTRQGLRLGSCPAQESQPITQGLGSRSLSSCLCG